MKLDSSVAAVVTGAASGLGAATARALAAQGVKVAIFDLNAEAGKAMAKEIGTELDITWRTCLWPNRKVSYRPIFTLGSF